MRLECIWRGPITRVRRARHEQVAKLTDFGVAGMLSDGLGGEFIKTTGRVDSWFQTHMGRLPNMGTFLNGHLP